MDQEDFAEIQKIKLAYDPSKIINKPYTQSQFIIPKMSLVKVQQNFSRIKFEKKPVYEQTPLKKFDEYILKFKNEF
jgi:hypothetical protein